MWTKRCVHIIYMGLFLPQTHEKMRRQLGAFFVNEKTFGAVKNRVF